MTVLLYSDLLCFLSCVIVGMRKMLFGIRKANNQRRDSLSPSSPPSLPPH